MKRLKLVLAFGLGFTSAAALGFTGGSVKAGNPDAVKILEDRLRNLEQAAASGHLPETVSAPFQVMDPSTHRAIFYVNDGKVAIRNKAGMDMAYITADEKGGTLVTTDSTFNLITSVSASGDTAGLNVYEGGKLKVDLGRRPDKGTYRLLFYKGEKLPMAGIGQAESGTGLAFVSDSNGNIKGRMGIAEGDKGIIWVTNSDGQSIAELTEGESGGGRMALFNNKGENMVVAGVSAGGFGVVRAGPGSFMPGYGTLGLPGSFIMGKSK